jgi:hypothetical protein
MNPLLLKTLLGAGLALGIAAGGWLAYDHVYTRGDHAGYTRAQGEAAAATLKLERTWQKEKDDAVAEAEKRATASAASAATARALTERMLGVISDANRRIATAPQEAVRQYAATVNEVFGQCVQEYRGLAAKADGHADDIKTLMDAWPK